jgi:Arc/MetJ-type ribon-helix-helix transcriptional regulator
VADMVRKQIYLERRQDRELKRLARRTQKTESELIRAGLDALLEEQQARRRRKAAMKRFLGCIDERMAKGPLPGKREWKREDIYNDAATSLR